MKIEIERMESWVLALGWAQARGIDTTRLRNAVALAHRNAIQPNRPETPPIFRQAGKEADALLRRMDSPAMRERVGIAAHLAGITPEQFRAGVHNLVWATENLNPTRQDGTQGRSQFTRFVRALDINLGIMGLPEMSAHIVAALYSELAPDDPRTGRDVELLRARPYVDEEGSETGEIIPDPPPVK